MRDDGDVRGAMGRLRRMYHGEPVQSVYAGTITAAYDRVRHDEETVARFAVAVIDDVTDDVRAAAERVRAHRAVMARHPEATDEGDLFGFQLASSPYYDAGWKGVNGGRLDADRRVLADAYLAEHPADDAAPVTAGWLESMGFQVKGGWWQLRCGDYEVYCYTSPSRPSGFVFKYESHDCLDDGDGAAILPDLPTRGDVRRLLAALKIATTEAVS